VAKRVCTWNQEKYDEFIRMGRGQGEGKEYLPWLNVQSFSSRGIVSRIKGIKTQRVHHLFSRNELYYFYLLECQDDVIDIREQFPLINIELATNIAAEAGIRYPCDRKSNFPYVLTCDFMVTTSAGLKARTIKCSAELSNNRVLEKLEIERRYWKKYGIDWRIVTEREVDFADAKNIELLRMSICQKAV